MTGPALIAVDWGTTSFRAYLLAVDGTILDRKTSKEGILSLVPRGDAAARSRPPGAEDFERALTGAVGNWRRADPRLPILLSGMIGSRQGWVEAPYVRCPAGVDEIAAKLMAVPTSGLGNVWLVPGLDTRDAAGRPDVMRGEEVQVFGVESGATANALGGRLPEGESPSATKKKHHRPVWGRRGG